MYLIIFIDGWIMGTSTKGMADYLANKYAGLWSSVMFMENITRAIEHCNEVVE